MAIVYVLSKDGKPLMPTTRCGRVRCLLKAGNARVVERKPFTIQLLYETEGATQPLCLGIDPGRTNIGMAVVKENGEPVMLIAAESRNKEVPKNMAARKEYRRAHRRHRRERKRRRATAAGTTVVNGEIARKLPGYEKPVVCHDIRNKEARFNNRRRPNGWLTPTANHLLETHLNLVRKVQKFLPITDVVAELNRFAFVAMENPKAKPWEYQRGPLNGFGGVKGAVFSQQDGVCLLCRKPIEAYHHVVPRSKGGSETLANRVGLCEEHHHLVHTDDACAAKVTAKKSGLNKKYHALSVLNQIIPYLMDALGDMFPDHAMAVDGIDTKAYRISHGVDKDHYLDAYCIACIPIDKFHGAVKHMEQYKVRQFRRHDRQACHQQRLNREYLKDGKTVATNRRKAFEQKAPSLSEYAGSTDCLTVKPHKPIYKRLDRIMPGAIFSTAGAYKVSVASQGSYNGLPQYYIFADGERATPRKCTIMLQNTGLVFV